MSVGTCEIPQAGLLETVFPFLTEEGFKHRDSCIVAVKKKSNKIFPVVTALWFHLFPFRTEKLSTVAPMVLHSCGRVGRRHFMKSPEFREELGALFLCFAASTEQYWHQCLLFFN